MYMYIKSFAGYILQSWVKLVQFVSYFLGTKLQKLKTCLSNFESELKWLKY